MSAMGNLLSDAEQAGRAVQQVSPIATFEALVGAIIALSRTPLGVDGLVLLAEIDRLNRKGVHPDLEMLRRIVGEPKTKLWLLLHDIEGQKLVKTRHSRRTQRLVLGITPAGRQALASAAHELTQGDASERIDQPHHPVIVSPSRQNSPVTQSTTPSQPVDAVRQRRRLAAVR
ncbi:hypothetical protein E4V01_00430 [Methylorubrum sp. Q1]|uniref:hypothetical protein n=1 Tax=Methylorubrum sp. Q1 TaxID=2562453 RepID=UPI001075DD9A|nr:hypothetical protein [Methylorubrum sp. Q1]TFZ61114.1 hypothetical protein E4V01_00430 [Methylorubrum sp. Q1]